MVRAKFKVQKFESQIFVKHSKDGTYNDVEMRTITLVPVYSSDSNSENKRFWDATPSGEIHLGTVNPDAWNQFELGKEYYVDFSLANQD